MVGFGDKRLWSFRNSHGGASKTAVPQKMRLDLFAVLADTYQAESQFL
jgi:hypothetical protein